MLNIISTISENPNSSDRTFIMEMYQQFNRLMFSTARKYCMDSDMCEEVVQESLLKLIEKTNTLKSMQQPVLASYIVSTIRNTAIDYLKSKDKQNAHNSSLEDEAFSNLEAPNIPLDELIYLVERKEYLVKMFDQLPTKDRLLLEGKYFFDYSDNALAKLLSCKKSSIRMKLTRARRRILKLIEKEGDDVNDQT